DDASKDAPLSLLGGYAHRESATVPERLALGEGLVGQCAKEKEKILIEGAPADYIRVSSGLGEAPPLNITVLPVLFEGQIKAVIELASFNRFSEIQLNFLEQLTESIGIVLNTIASTMRTEDLLKQSQSLAQELQKTNAQLEEKATLLSEQKKEVEAKNREIEVARQSLEEKAEQLALTSKYKSQFLANMSHELRTPLNSLLILARTLAENAEKNLSGKQVEFAKTIHGSGKDLLALINDILDLSKIESGTMSLEIGELRFGELREYVERGFLQIAQERGLQFTVELDERLPRTFRTDSKRLQQVLRNLLSNALKFTEKGKVSLRMALAADGWSSDQDTLNRAESVLAFSVEDTGIGIPLNKQKIIFEAFQQVDMTTSRKYGGTGLGLSISREIAKMLGGEIQVRSAPGEGSTFTLYLPLAYVAPKARQEPVSLDAGVAAENPPAEGEAPAPAEEFPAPLAAEIEDDRDAIVAGDQVLLVIEDDAAYARILLEMARKAGFKGLVATRGDRGLALARKYLPGAVTLDLRLPDMDGWAVFDQLKNDPQTRHIPVHILSVEEQNERGLSQGAFAYMIKPSSVEPIARALERMKGYLASGVRNLLVVEDNEVQRKAVVELLSMGDVKITAVASGQEALEALAKGGFDCMVLDLKLPDMTGYELITRLKREAGAANLPIIVYTGKELNKKEERELRKVTQSIIVKDARSPERLLDETSLFLHQPQAALDEGRRRMITELHQQQPLLADKTVLIVDDDVRNIFALTSVLERYRMKVVYAENGKAGLEILQANPDIEIVLMDVMMPDMDGYETMRAIRGIEKYRELPIIALTAKAMKGDREKCIEAGASDYIPKPVDVEQLLSLLRVWLYRYAYGK
ncbi:MAG TPA: response regulator, partial [Elusimicrobiota bacterium]|nr:response regulator [Elusimicrobiota bacterium]